MCCAVLYCLYGYCTAQCSCNAIQSLAGDGDVMGCEVR